MKISVKSNVDKVVRRNDEIANKQMPYAASRALNKTAWELKEAENKELANKLDRPKPFTTKAFLYKKSSKRNLRVTVYAKKVQEKYLNYQLDGGTRLPNKTSIPIPVGVKLNKYGNIPRTALPRMFSDKNKFFVGIPKGAKRQTPGIYRRYPVQAKGKRSKRIELQIKFQSSASYTAKLDLDGVAERLVKKTFPSEFEKALRNAIKTAR